MASAKNGQNIIDEFRVLTDEQDDLSAAERLALAQEVIDLIDNMRDWGYLVKTATGTLTTSDLEYDLPTDFRQLTENWEDLEEIPHRVLFVGTNFDRYPFINMAQRRRFRDSRGYAFIDYRQQKLVLTDYETSSRSYEFDYIHNPVDITVSTSPLIPVQFHVAIPKMMAKLWTHIDQTDKTFSYALENDAEFKKLINTMELQDAQSYNQAYL